MDGMNEFLVVKREQSLSLKSLAEVSGSGGF